MKRNLLAWAASAAIAATAGVAQAQVSDGVIKIGVLTDMSSLYTDLSGKGSELAARMAVEDFGAAAKGLKVEIVSADHQNKPDVGSSIARQWYDVDKIDVIVDVPNSGVALAVNQITRDKGKAFLVSGAASADLTGKACSPNTIHWAYDTWMLANGTGNAIVKTGGDSWFFLTADYAFGHALERDTEAVVLKNGGKVLGKVRHPLEHQDFSSFLLQAQASKAKIIGLANAGGDTTNSIKQAAEFGIVKAGQSLAGLLVFITDVHCAGAADGAGPDLHRDVLLGCQRRDARLCQAFRRGQPRHPPDHDPRRRLLLGAALPQGGRGRQVRRRHQDHRQDEGDADRRSAVRQGLDPRGRPQAAPGLSGRGQEAQRIQGPVGLSQDPRHDPGRPGLPPDG